MQRGLNQRPLGPLKFCLILIGVALVLLALPYPAPSQVKRIFLIHTTRAQVAIVGPSTIDYVSDCDADRRTVAKMLSDEMGAGVMDLSLGGQTLSDSLNLAAASGAAPSIKDVILPLAHPQVDDWTTPPYRRLLVYKAMAPTFRGFQASNFSDFWSGLTNQPRRVELGYHFNGRDYADYRVLSVRQFANEKRLSSCPEALTHDLEFTRSYFWWTHIPVKGNASLYDLIGDLSVSLAAKGVRLHVVVLPTNLQLMGQLDPAWPRIVQGKQQQLVTQLRRRSVDVIDLSDAFASEEFSTKWCACIHLNEVGRQHLVRAIAQDVNAASAVDRPQPRPETTKQKSLGRQ